MKSLSCATIIAGPPPHRLPSITLLAVVLAAAGACGLETAPPAPAVEELAGAQSAEDGLGEAFARFQQDFGDGDLLRIGLGHHPGLSSEKLVVNGLPAAARVTLFLPAQQVRAQLDGFPPSGDFDLWFVKNVGGVGPVAAFLREINAAENLRQVKKRTNFVLGRRSGSNSAILDVAIADTDDAVGVLADKGLNAEARAQLGTARAALVTARSKADSARTADLRNALGALDAAKAALLTADPHGDF